MKKNKIKLFDQLTPVILKSNGASKESGESADTVPAINKKN